MSRFLLSHHLGMGDHIAMNGIVRHVYERESKRFDHFYLLCYKHNAANVKRMYQDLNIELLLIDTTDNPDAIIREFAPDKYEDFHLGENGLKLYNEIADFTFCDCFGYDRKLLLEGKIEFTPEQTKRCEEVYAKYAPDGEYIFLHEDPERGFVVDRQRMRPLPIITISKNVPLFDAYLLMKRAAEIHVISSAFLCMALYIKDLNARSKTITHLYIRNKYLKNYLDICKVKALV